MQQCQPLEGESPQTLECALCALTGALLTMLSYISNETPENVDIALHTGWSRWTFINTLSSYSVSLSVLFS